MRSICCVKSQCFHIFLARLRSEGSVSPEMHSNCVHCCKMCVEILVQANTGPRTYLLTFVLQMVGMKRPSPEPADNSLAKIQKKPKVQKKKKKRDPNEPQK